MIKHIALAASVAAAALAATPALARPMTATDMHMMRRVGAPSVSPDGRYALFSLSTTGRGVADGTMAANQPTISTPGVPASVMVGSSGTACMRCGVETASMRRRPARACDSANTGSIMP